MTKVPKEYKGPANEQDLHEGMKEGGVIFNEEPPVDDERWKKMVAKMNEMREDQEERDRRDRIKVVVNG